MRKTILRNSLACLGLAMVLFQSCKNDSKLTVAPPPADASFSESFDNFNEALAKGWTTVNKSNPVGPYLYDVAEVPNFGTPNYVCTYFPKWEQAQLTLDSLQFPNAPYPGRYWKDAFFSQRGSNGYAATSAACSRVFRLNSDPRNYKFTVNSWLVSPELTIKNGDKITFYTYSSGAASLQLFINPTGSLNVGDGDADVNGDFTIPLVDIPYQATDPHATYPKEWTKFEGEVKGLNAVVKGRFGFRYYLKQQEPFKLSTRDPNDLDTVIQQVHQTVIGIDEVSFKSAQ